MHRRHDGLNIPIEVLRSFVAIQESGSFTKAADQLQLTQPAISAQIKRLQKLVGGEVFTRKGFGVSLTEKGEIVSRYARRILAMNDQILSLSGNGTSDRMYRIGIPTAFAGSMLKHVISACKSLLNGEQVRFTCEPCSDLARGLAGGYLDIAFLASLVPQSGHVVARWPETAAWVCAPELDLRPGALVPLLSWPNGISDQAAIHAIESVGLQYSIVYVASDYAAQLAALRAGIGFHCLPERLVPKDLKIVRDRVLPSLPSCEAGVYLREGLDSEHAIALAKAVADVVRPVENKVMRVGELRSRRA